MNYSHVKVQGQRSVSSEDREETNGRVANAVGNNTELTFTGLMKEVRHSIILSKLRFSQNIVTTILSV